MKFFINYLENNKSVHHITEEEEVAAVIIDSAIAGGASYVSVVVIVPIDEDKGQFDQGYWKSSGQTYLKGWYNVYHLGVVGH